MDGEKLLRVLNPFVFHEGFGPEIGKAFVTSLESLAVLALVHTLMAEQDAIVVGNCVMGAGMFLSGLHALVGFGALKQS